MSKECGVKVEDDSLHIKFYYDLHIKFYYDL